jgi:hypothetical protein
MTGMDTVAPAGQREPHVLVEDVLAHRDEDRFEVTPLPGGDEFVDALCVRHVD